MSFTTIEFGRLTASFNWNGTDTEYQVETGASPPPPPPTPAPVGSATITLRHLFRGIPVIAFIDHRISIGDVGGVPCGYGHTTDVQGAEAIVSIVRWPWHDYSPCNAVGLPVHVCVGFDLCSEEFIFDGHDTTVDMNWPESAFQGVTFGRVHFKRDNASQPVTLESLTLASGGAKCFSLSWPQWRGDTPVATISDLAHFFPTVPCSRVGESVDATFETVEFGELHATFVWNGGDVDYDVAIPSAETPSPGVTASPTAPVTAAALPQAGGPPANAEGALPLVAGGLAAMAAGAGGWLIARRRPRPSE